MDIDTNALKAVSGKQHVTSADGTRGDHQLTQSELLSALSGLQGHFSDLRCVPTTSSCCKRNLCVIRMLRSLRYRSFTLRHLPCCDQDVQKVKVLFFYLKLLTLLYHNFLALVLPDC